MKLIEQLTIYTVYKSYVIDGRHMLAGDKTNKN